MSLMLLTLESSPVLLKIEKEWKILAKVLEIPEDVVELIRYEILCDINCPKKILSTILVNWRLRKGKKANIVTFIKILEEQCHWLGIGSKYE